MHFRQDVIAAIGNMPLTKLRRASEFTGCTLLDKPELLNLDQGLPSVTGGPAGPSTWDHWLDESKSPSLKRLAQSAAATDNPRHSREHIECTSARNRRGPPRPASGQHDAPGVMRFSRARALSHLVGLALVTALAGLASAEPPVPQPPPDNTASSSHPSVCENLTTQALQVYKVPGRKPESQMPWELFLGNASHRLIAYIYRTRYPTNTVFYNKQTVKNILEKQGIGDWSLLLENELELRPDITDITARSIFEIKPHNEKGLQEGMRKVQMYLLALNRAVPPDNRFSGGQKFEGEILIQFAQGQFIWRLEWCTTTPGVTQYRWTRSQERFDSNAAAYNAAQWVEISEQELKQYGGWVAQAADGMVDRRERIATISGAIGVAIDIVGEVAMIVISIATSGERGATQPGGKVLPFPSKPTAPPVQLPKASGM